MADLPKGSLSFGVPLGLLRGEEPFCPAFTVYTPAHPSTPTKVCCLQISFPVLVRIMAAQPRELWGGDWGRGREPGAPSPPFLSALPPPCNAAAHGKRRKTLLFLTVVSGFPRKAPHLARRKVHADLWSSHCGYQPRF